MYDVVPSGSIAVVVDNRLIDYENEVRVLIVTSIVPDTNGGSSENYFLLDRGMSRG